MRPLRTGDAHWHVVPLLRVTSLLRLHTLDWDYDSCVDSRGVRWFEIIAYRGGTVI